LVVPENRGAAGPGVVTPEDQRGRRPGRGARARATSVLLLAVLVGALAVGTYAFVGDLDSSSTAKAMDTFCSSVGAVMQLAYEHRGGLGTLHKLVDKDADAVGGQVLSDTKAFEVALSRRDTAGAEKRLLQLDELCNSEGSPISTPISTASPRT
jgi:hypothetical protein